MFTVGALDNIDHKPSATTAKGSFHGTGISIFQFPTLSNPGISQEPLVIEPNSSRKYFLPDSYTNVPTFSCKTDSLTMSEYVPPHECISVLNEGNTGEEMWIKHSLQVLTQNEPVTTEQSVTWAAFHVSFYYSLFLVQVCIINCVLQAALLEHANRTLYQASIWAVPLHPWVFVFTGLDYWTDL